MLWKRLAVLVAAAMIVLSMLVAAPAFAQECSGASCELQPGQTEKNNAPILAPAATKPGHGIRDPDANEHDTHTICTGRGERILVGC